jgi:hypothetical protein
MSRNASVVISITVIIPLIVGVVVLFAEGYFVFLAKH